MPATIDQPRIDRQEAPESGQRRVDYVHGPIVSSSDLEAHLALFAGFGMTEVGRLCRTADEVRAIWGIAGHVCEEVSLATSGTRFGARLVRFDPGENLTIRTIGRGEDYDALKVIDFYAPDLEAARKHIEAAGFRFKDTVASYETPEGQFQEAHVWGPDGVVCALISGNPDFFRDFATVRGRLVSEPQSISGPVRDPQATLDFFRDIFGLEPIHTYAVQDDSFQALVGAKREMRLRAWNVGPRLDEPYFGVIDYGLPGGVQHSLRDRARPPARGLLGATLIVPDVAAIVPPRPTNGQFGPVETEVAGIGPARLLTLQAPNGGWYQAVQPLELRRT